MFLEISHLSQFLCGSTLDDYKSFIVGPSIDLSIFKRFHLGGLSSGEGQSIFSPVTLGTTEAGEPTAGVATVRVALRVLLDNRPQVAVLLLRTLPKLCPKRVKHIKTYLRKSKDIEILEPEKRPIAGEHYYFLHFRFLDCSLHTKEITGSNPASTIPLPKGLSPLPPQIA
jgi:hypothetical protein